MDEFRGLFGLVVIAFGLVLAIAWIMLPFAMFGLKPLLLELIAETKRTNALLERREVVLRDDAKSGR